MSGGIHSVGWKPAPGQCPWCWGELHVSSDEWTGGPTGFTAVVECSGCDMRGPGHAYVRESRENAERAAIAVYAKDREELAELRGRWAKRPDPPQSARDFVLSRQPDARPAWDYHGAGQTYHMIQAGQDGQIIGIGRSEALAWADARRRIKRQERKKGGPS